MSALTDITSGPTLPEEIKKVILEYAAPLFWGWYHTHENDVVLKVGWWFIKKTVHVYDLHSIFVLLFGDDPAVATN